DPLVPAKFARHVAEAVPSAVSMVLEDCGHVPHFEHPERTHWLIRQFLSGQIVSSEMGRKGATVTRLPSR
ncbi:MAG TPA: alpha/beta hydrolase, partial [Polyangiaceae bacterium]